MYYENFKRLCEQENVTPAEVSRHTGIATSTLTNWKKGTYTPKIDKLKKIADFFGVPVETIQGIDPQEVIVTTRLQNIAENVARRESIEKLLEVAIISSDADIEVALSTLQRLKAYQDRIKDLASANARSTQEGIQK